MQLCPAFPRLATDAVSPPLARAALAAAALALAACSPALDWRTVRQDTSPVAAMMPCKPERAEREVPLLGPQQPPVSLRMLSCEAAGHTFAVATVALPQPLPSGQTVAQWMDAWQRASWATLQVAPALAGSPASPPSDPASGPVPSAAPAAVPGWAAVPCQVRGATASRCMRGPGRAPGGEAVQAELHWAANGRWLVQAAVYGPGLSADAHETFFRGVTLD